MTDDDVILAGEYVLGLLDAEARAVAEQRILADAAFAGEVARWRERFAGLLAEVPAVPPPEGLHARIARRLGRSDSGGWWPLAFAAALLLAIGLGLVLALQPGATPPLAPPSAGPAPIAAPKPVLIATMQGEAKPFTAYVLPHGEGIALVGAARWPADRSAQLWVIGADSVPRPLGLAKGAEPVRLAADIRSRLVPGATLAVSIEPPGGSRQAGPSGPVVATGVLTRAG